VAYRVRAHNPATASENRIHADEVAREHGFRGGLVPGVVTWAYLARPVVERLGRTWLESGEMAARFAQPVYEDDEVAIAADGEGDGRLTLTATNALGVVCATGSAALPTATSSDPLPLPRRPLPEERPPASDDTLAVGTALGTFEATFRADHAPAYLADIRDDLALWREGIAHPGWLLSLANYALSANVRLGPWVHTASTVRHRAVVGDGDHVEVRGRVADRYARKGHELVELDLVYVVDDRAVWEVRHTAIWRLASGR
jgi:acyl dehydratase